MSTPQEKIGQAAQAVKDKAIEAKNYVAGPPPTEAEKAAQAAKDKAAEAAQATKDAAQAAKDKAAEAAQATKDKGDELVKSGKDLAASGKDESGGFLQKTGEQVKGLAQGAADAVKNTFAGGENKVVGK